MSKRSCALWQSTDITGLLIVNIVSGEELMAQLFLGAFNAMWESCWLLRVNSQEGGQMRGNRTLKSPVAVVVFNFAGCSYCVSLRWQVAGGGASVLQRYDCVPAATVELRRQTDTLLDDGANGGRSCRFPPVAAGTVPSAQPSHITVE